MEDNIIKTPKGEFIAIDWETLTIDSVILDLGISCISTIRDYNSQENFAAHLAMGYNQDVRTSPVDSKDILLSCAYGSGLMAYHRFVRQNITHPNKKLCDSYKELIPLLRK